MEKGPEHLIMDQARLLVSSVPAREIGMVPEPFASYDGLPFIRSISIELILTLYILVELLYFFSFTP
jgi:hypothetical protein